MTAVDRPLREEWFERSEVDIERGVGPGCSALVPVQQDQQPGPDHHSEAGGQVTGAVLDPGPDRRGRVVLEQPEAGEDLGDSRRRSVPGRAVADLTECHRSVSYTHLTLPT